MVLVSKDGAAFPMSANTLRAHAPVFAAAIARVLMNQQLNATNANANTNAAATVRAASTMAAPSTSIPSPTSSPSPSPCPSLPTRNNVDALLEPTPGEVVLFADALLLNPTRLPSVLSHYLVRCNTTDFPKGSTTTLEQARLLQYKLMNTGGDRNKSGIFGATSRGNTHNDDKEDDQDDDGGMENATFALRPELDALLAGSVTLDHPDVTRISASVTHVVYSYKHQERVIDDEVKKGSASANHDELQSLINLLTPSCLETYPLIGRERKVSLAPASSSSSSSTASSTSSSATAVDGADYSDADEDNTEGQGLRQRRHRNQAKHEDRTSTSTSSTLSSSLPSISSYSPSQRLSVSLDLSTPELEALVDIIFQRPVPLTLASAPVLLSLTYFFSLPEAFCQSLHFLRDHIVQFAASPTFYALPPELVMRLVHPSPALALVHDTQRLAYFRTRELLHFRPGAHALSFLPPPRVWELVCDWARMRVIVSTSPHIRSMLVDHVVNIARLGSAFSTSGATPHITTPASTLSSSPSSPSSSFLPSLLHSPVRTLCSLAHKSLACVTGGSMPYPDQYWAPLPRFRLQNLATRCSLSPTLCSSSSPTPSAAFTSMYARCVTAFTFPYFDVTAVVTASSLRNGVRTRLPDTATPTTTSATFSSSFSDSIPLSAFHSLALLHVQHPFYLSLGDDVDVDVDVDEVGVTATPLSTVTSAVTASSSSSSHRFSLHRRAGFCFRAPLEVPYSIAHVPGQHVLCDYATSLDTDACFDEQYAHMGLFGLDFAPLLQLPVESVSAAVEAGEVEGGVYGCGDEVKASGCASNRGDREVYRGEDFSTLPSMPNARRRFAVALSDSTSTSSALPPLSPSSPSSISSPYSTTLISSPPPSPLLGLSFSSQPAYRIPLLLPALVRPVPDPFITNLMENGVYGLASYSPIPFRPAHPPTNRAGEAPNTLVDVWYASSLKMARLLQSLGSAGQQHVTFPAWFRQAPYVQKIPSPEYSPSLFGLVTPVPIYTVSRGSTNGCCCSTNCAHDSDFLLRTGANESISVDKANDSISVGKANDSISVDKAPSCVSDANQHDRNDDDDDDSKARSEAAGPSSSRRKSSQSKSTSSMTSTSTSSSLSSSSSTFLVLTQHVLARSGILRSIPAASVIAATTSSGQTERPSMMRNPLWQSPFSLPAELRAAKACSSGGHGGGGGGGNEATRDNVAGITNLSPTLLSTSSSSSSSSSASLASPLSPSSTSTSSSTPTTPLPGDLEEYAVNVTMASSFSDSLIRPAARLPEDAVPFKARAQEGLALHKEVILDAPTSLVSSRAQWASDLGEVIFLACVVVYLYWTLSSMYYSTAPTSGPLKIILMAIAAYVATVFVIATTCPIGPAARVVLRCCGSPRTGWRVLTWRQMAYVVFALLVLLFVAWRLVIPFELFARYLITGIRNPPAALNIHDPSIIRFDEAAAGILSACEAAAKWSNSTAWFNATAASVAVQSALLPYLVTSVLVPVASLSDEAQRSVQAISQQLSLWEAHLDPKRYTIGIGALIHKEKRVKVSLVEGDKAFEITPYSLKSASGFSPLFNTGGRDVPAALAGGNNTGGAEEFSLTTATATASATGPTVITTKSPLPRLVSWPDTPAKIESLLKVVAAAAWVLPPDHEETRANSTSDASKEGFWIKWPRAMWRKLTGLGRRVLFFFSSSSSSSSSSPTNSSTNSSSQAAELKRAHLTGAGVDELLIDILMNGPRGMRNLSSNANMSSNEIYNDPDAVLAAIGSAEDLALNATAHELKAFMTLSPCSPHHSAREEADRHNDDDVRGVRGGSGDGNDDGQEYDLDAVPFTRECVAWLHRVAKTTLARQELFMHRAATATAAASAAVAYSPERGDSDGAASGTVLDEELPAEVQALISGDPATAEPRWSRWGTVFHDIYTMNPDGTQPPFNYIMPLLERNDAEEDLLSGISISQKEELAQVGKTEMMPENNVEAASQLSSSSLASSVEDLAVPRQFPRRRRRRLSSVTAGLSPQTAKRLLAQARIINQVRSSGWAKTRRLWRAVRRFFSKISLYLSTDGAALQSMKRRTPRNVPWTVNMKPGLRHRIFGSRDPAVGVPTDEQIYNYLPHKLQPLVLHTQTNVFAAAETFLAQVELPHRKARTHSTSSSSSLSTAAVTGTSHSSNAADNNSNKDDDDDNKNGKDGGQVEYMDLHINAELLSSVDPEYHALPVEAETRPRSSLSGIKEGSLTPVEVKRVANALRALHIKFGSRMLLPDCEKALSYVYYCQLVELHIGYWFV